MDMTVRDLFSNPTFDVNCRYVLYDCNDGRKWNDAPILFVSGNPGEELTESMMNKRIRYITIDRENNHLVVEVIDEIEY